MFSGRQMLSACCWLWLFVCISGCGDAPRQYADAQGVLSFNEKPLAGYSVFFQSADGVIASGTSDEEGRFKLESGDREGAPVGECKVYIHEKSDRLEFDPEQVVDLTAEEMFKMQHAKRSKPRDPEKKKLGVPPKYSIPEQSGLKFTVDADSDKNNFEIKLAK